MGYRLKEGIVLFRMFDGYYLFPSRKAGAPVSFLITVPDDLVSLIGDKKDQPACKPPSEETARKIQRLIKLGFIEEDC